MYAKPDDFRVYNLFRDDNLLLRSVCIHNNYST